MIMIIIIILKPFVHHKYSHMTYHWTFFLPASIFVHSVIITAAIHHLAWHTGGRHVMTDSLLTSFVQLSYAWSDQCSQNITTIVNTFVHLSYYIFYLITLTQFSLNFKGSYKVTQVMMVISDNFYEDWIKVKYIIVRTRRAFFSALITAQKCDLIWRM